MTTEADLRRAGYPPVRKADETVTISCAQHEALMAAAKVVMDRDSDGKEWIRKRYEALAALRAAGILEEK